MKMDSKLVRERAERLAASAEATFPVAVGPDGTANGGASDTELTQAILAGIAAKPERHEFNERPQQIVRFMSQTGG